MEMSPFCLDLTICQFCFKDIDDIGRCEFAVFDTTSFDSEEIAVCIEGRIFKASIYDSGLSTIGRYSDSL